VINAILRRPAATDADGAWRRILDRMIVEEDSMGGPEWIVSVDSSAVQAHHHAAESRKEGCAAGAEAFALDG
jgi:hypothetical protein